VLVPACATAITADLIAPNLHTPELNAAMAELEGRFNRSPNGRAPRRARIGRHP
jgi:hypothetical protein